MLAEWRNYAASTAELDHSAFTACLCIVELEWLEHLWNHDNMFETGVVRGNEC